MAKAKLEFLQEFGKELDKMDGIGTSSKPPRYWYTTSNHALNRVISGSFFKGVPQGRVTNFAGPSGGGKSFLAANVVRAAQEAGAAILIVDSENALDDEFMGKIGVNVGRENQYYYAGVTTINDVTRVVSRFLNGYQDSVGDDLEGQQALILIDSLDMLITETEEEHYAKGVQKGDQGQRNKQLKQMLRTFVQAIKNLNVTIICTSQVYKNQDVMNGEGVWIVSDAVKYAASQIVLLTKLKLRDKKLAAERNVTGIQMKCEGYKTRFTKPFQKVTVEVPYESGMDPYSGLLEAAEELGVIVKTGKQFIIAGKEEKWFGTNINDYAEQILLMCEAKANVFLKGSVSETDEDTATETPEATASRRLNKAKKKK